MKGVRLIDIPVITDLRGDLGFVEGRRHVPFDIGRVYSLHNVPGDATRGGHAHRELEEVIFALSGSFRIRLDDGATRVEYWLNDPHKGLYVGPLVWLEMDCFSTGAICMVLASLPYEEADYLRDHAAFITAAKAVRP